MVMLFQEPGNISQIFHEARAQQISRLLEGHVMPSTKISGNFLVGGDFSEMSEADDNPDYRRGSARSREKLDSRGPFINSKSEANLATTTASTELRPTSHEYSTLTDHPACRRCRSWQS